MSIKVLNVAEKPSVAKEIAKILSGDRFRTRDGFSPYNRVFEFEYTLDRQNVQMVVTSVSGHLMSTDFQDSFRSWQGCDPIALFEAPVIKQVPENNSLIAKTLQREARPAKRLILWLDCDREGENIGFEVVECCKAANPRISISRARFSALTPRDVQRAMATLGPPNERDSWAVDVRQELDLRIGAAFTRFQTMRFRSRFQLPSDTVLSYGPCQFPTLGFVVERFIRREFFVPEKFWGISCSERRQDGTCEFSWSRHRLFDRLVCLTIYDVLMDDPTATVTKIIRKEKRKWRPVPLATVELQKLAARKLRMSSEKCMEVAEKLYNEGILSYPRTETDQFTFTDDELAGMIRMQEVDPNWGSYATRLLNGEYERPRRGKNDDKAHPPIHPTKAAPHLEGDQKRLYELVTRHYLACCSRDAVGNETVITLDICGEVFTASGLMITQYNFLEVYPYEKWSDKNIPVFAEGETFVPTSLVMTEGSTTAPPLLSEADLIAAMDTNGIGTDATIAQHIKTIQDRGYAIRTGNNVFEPTELGLALVEGYDDMGFELSKPNLRARLEADMKKISEGTKTKEEVLRTAIQMYKAVFQEVIRNEDKLAAAMRRHFDEIGSGAGAQVMDQGVSTCGTCGDLMDLKKQGEKRFMYCNQCRKAHTLPRKGALQPADHTCPLCNFQVLSCLTEKGSTYHLCPKCFQDPPRDLVADIENATSGFRCFTCSAPNCKLATKTSEQPIRQCTVCKSAPMVLKRKKDGTGFFISCKGFPACKNSTWLPSSTTEVTPTQEICRQCTPRSGSQKDRVFLLKMKFDRSKIPASMMPEITACAFCDPQIAELSQFGGRSGSGSSLPRATLAPPPPRSSNPILAVQSGSNMSGYLANRPPPPMPPPPPRTIAPPPPLPSDDGDMNCTKCGTPAVQKTVRKEGDNKGRPFWSCPNSCQGFFVWADEAQAQQQPQQSWSAPSPSVRGGGNASFGSGGGGGAPWKSGGSGNGGSSGFGGGGRTLGSSGSMTSTITQTSSGSTTPPNCECGNSARKQVCRNGKPENVGKEFWSCAKSRDAGDRCNFFSWVDDENSGGGGGSGGSWPASGPKPPGGSSSGGSSGGWAKSGAAWVKAPSGESGSGSEWNKKRKGGGSEQQPEPKKGRTVGTKSENSDGQKKKRTCSVCRQEGHTKKTCPSAKGGDMSD